MVSRLKMATYDVRTLLRDKHVKELEEFMEVRLMWDVIGSGEVRRREECFTTLQSGHLLQWKVKVNRISPKHFCA